MRRLSRGLLTGLFVLPVLVGCERGTRGVAPAPLAPASPRVDGSSVGNGGDFLRALFEQGRQQATRILGLVTRSYFSNAASSAEEAADVSWILAKRNALLTTLRSARLHWVRSLPADKCPFHSRSACGCVDPGAPLDLYFSYETCQGVESISAAGEMVVHEALHAELGRDEDQVYRIAALLYRPWNGLGNPDLYRPLSPFPSDPFGLTEKVEPKLATYFFFPDTSFWWNHRFVSLFPFYPRFGSVHADSLGGAIWNSEFQPRLDFLFSTRERVSTGWPVLRYSGTRSVVVGGMVYLFFLPNRSFPPSDAADRYHAIRVDPQGGRWEPLSPIGAPGIDLEQPTWDRALHSGLLAAGDELMVWGFASSQRGDELRAWRYDPKTDRWRAAKRLPHRFSAPRVAAAEWAAGRAVFWGLAGDEGLSPRGLLYDTKADTWTEISHAGAPSVPAEAAGHPLLSTSTGREFLVMGCAQSSVYGRRDGGILDPVRNVWKPMRVLPGPDSCSGVKSVWAENRWILLDRRLHFYSPEEDEWTVSDRMPITVDLNVEALHWTGSKLVFWDPLRHKGFAFSP